MSTETRTYRGSSLEELLPRIRAELGDDAVVVRQREGLTGGVAGFFQKRTVEIEARAGRPASGVEWFAGDPDESVLAPSLPVPPPAADDGDDEDEDEGVVAAAPRPPVPPAAEPAPRHSPFAAYLSAAGVPEPQPDPDPVPEPVDEVQPAPEPEPAGPSNEEVARAEGLMRDALARQARDLAAEAPPTTPTPYVTSPQVDALPGRADDEGNGTRAAQAAFLPPSSLSQPEPEPEPEPAPAPEPPPPPPARPRPEAPAAPALARPQAARHIAATLAARGVPARMALEIVDDALAHRVPLAPGTRLQDLVADVLSARIPVAPPSGPQARIVVLAGPPAGGGGRIVAGLAAAYAMRTAVPVECVALGTPDGGRALAAVLGELGVPVHSVRDGAEAAGHLATVGDDTLVVVDTAPVLDAGAPGLAADLAALGPHELHLVLGAGGTAAAPGLIAALRPARLSIGDPSDAAHVGAAVALAIEHDVPISLVASTVAAGRPDLAVNPADATSLARTLSG